MEYSSFDAPSLPPPGGRPAPTTATIAAGLTAPTLFSLANYICRDTAFRRLDKGRTVSGVSLAEGNQ